MSGQPGFSRRALLGLFRAPARSRTPESRESMSAVSAGTRAPVAAAEPRAPAASATPRVPMAAAFTEAREAVTPRASMADAEPRASMAAAVVDPREAVAPRAPATGAPASSRSPTFSLESFYAARSASGQACTDRRIPVFNLRQGLAVPQQASTEVRHEPGSPRGTLAGEGGTPLTAPVSGPAVRQEARPATPRLGATVRVRTGFCLAWQGSFCSTCVERCPIPGAIVMEAGRPRVVDERCDGCGTCVRVCPAPFNAFELRPAASPGAPS
jgi:ferredoxin